MQIDDKICDLGCMNIDCEFDGGTDCDADCTSLGCDTSLLGDGVCHSTCNFEACGFDYGDCGYCAADCTEAMLTNTSLDPECSTEACYYDSSLANECSAGCTNEKLLNTECDPECNFSLCNFDYGSCTEPTECAPGCLSTSLGDTLCDAACDTAACNYDDYDCLCADACFEVLRGDGNCDDVCNTTACSYDSGDCIETCPDKCSSASGDSECDLECWNSLCDWADSDCGCAPDCLFEEMEDCKEECLVLACDYAKSDCGDTVLIDFAKKRQLIAADFTLVSRLSDCVEASTTNDGACSRDLLETPDCDNDLCNIEECAYTLGQCSGDCTANCGCSDCCAVSIYSQQLCLECDPDLLLQTFTSCFGNCPPGYEQSDNSTLCIPSADLSTSDNPTVLYLTGIVLDSENYGSGTEDDPFTSLAIALVNAVDAYTIIKIIGSESVGLDEFPDSYEFATLYGDDYLTNPNLKDLTIRPNSLDDIATLAVKSEDFLTFEFGGSLTFQSVTFTSEYSDDNCASYSCDYCCYEDCDDLYDDFCDAFREEILIRMTGSGSLNLYDVTFTNMRTEFFALIILTDGSLYMENVEFSQITVSRETDTAVILILCSDNSGLNNCGDFSYIGGSVTLLNDGSGLPDFDGDVRHNSFLYVANAHDLTLTGVTFEYNIVTSTSVITLVNFNQFIINDSRIQYNCLYEGFFSAAGSEIEFTVNENSEIAELLYDHITFSNLQVKNNMFAETGLIALSNEEFLQNVLIQDCTLQENVSLIGSLFDIISLGIEEWMKDSQYQWVKVDESRVQAWYTKHTVVFRNVTVDSNQVNGNGILRAAYLGNMQIDSCTISNNLEGTEQLTEFVVQYFIDNIDPTIEELEAKDYKNELMAFITVSGVGIIEWNNNIYSYHSASVTNQAYLTINNCESASVSSSEFLALTGDTDGSSTVKFTDTQEATVVDSTFTHCLFYSEFWNGVLEFVGEHDSSATVRNCTFTGSLTIQSKGIVSSIHTLTIEDSLFQYALISGDNSAYIYIQPSVGDADYTVTVLNTSMILIISSVGVNSGIYVKQSGSETINLHLNITDCRFEHFYVSSYMGPVRLEGNMNILESSKIYRSWFLNSDLSYSTIYLKVYYGELEIDNCTFANINVPLGGVIRSHSPSGFTLAIRNSELYDCLAYFVIGSDTFELTSNLITENVYIHDNQGTAIGLIRTVFNDTNSIFQNNNSSAPGSSAESAGLYVTTESEVNAVNTQFISNKSIKGGALYVTSQSVVNCQGCTITGNTATSGGGVYAESSTLTLSGTLSGNSATDGGAVFQLYQVTAGISNCEIFENSDASGEGMNFLSSLVECNGCIVHDNTSDSDGESRITSSFSAVRFTNSQFYNLQGSMLVLISCTSSELSIENSQVYNVNAPHAEHLIMLVSSSACTITNSQFTDITIGIYSILYASGSSIVTIDSSSFTSLSSEKAALYISNSALTMTNVHVQDYWGPAVFFTDTADASIYLADDTFEDGQTLGNSAGIEIYAGSAYTLERCTFNNLTSYAGGGLFVETTDSTSVTLASCSFSENSADWGGAVYSNNGLLTISDSSFTGNSANDPENHAVFAPAITSGRGGAIMFDCVTADVCGLAITNSSFANNFATHKGGALEWYTKKPTLMSNTFTNNSATYGNDIASFPVTLRSVNPDGTLVSDERRLSGEPTTTVDSLPSGQPAPTPLLIAVVDHYGNIVTTDHESQASLVSSSDNVTISGATTVSCDTGIYNFSDYSIIATPESSATISVESTAISSSVADGDDPGLYSQSVDIAIEMRACIKGEINSRDECVYCEANTYSLDPSESSCRNCPKNAICNGGDDLVPSAGYWRSGEDSHTIWECPNAVACLGSDSIETSVHGLCETGYKGNMCQSCEAGYSRTTPNVCQQCPEPEGNVIKLIGIVIGLILVSVFLVRSALNSAYKPAALHSVYFKIFVNYTQLVMITVNFDLDWPAYVQSLFDVQNNAGSATEQIFSLDCYLEGDESKTEALYYQKVVFMSVLPFMIVIISAAIWLIVALLSKTLRYLKEELVTTIIVLVFLVHPNIIKTMFSVINCTEIEPQQHWLVDNMDIECWDSTHTFYAVFVAIPSLIIWGVLTPAMCLYLLVKNRRQLHKLSVRKKFGFFFNGYTNREYYWEIIILARKILILFCAVLLSNISVTVQALSVMVIIIIFLYLQSAYTPFSHKSLNQMEIRSILVSAITIYCGLYYLTGDIDDLTKVILFILIILANVYFLFYWLYKLFEVGVALLASKVPFLRKHCLRGIHDGLDDDLFKIQEKDGHILGHGVDKMYRLQSSTQGPERSVRLKQGIQMKDLFIDVVYSTRKIPHSSRSSDDSDLSNKTL